tara:strand:- start:43 stop:345 length:303 start_codon:yes stop_codon:yes gene_type:complete
MADDKVLCESCYHAKVGIPVGQTGLLGWKSTHIKVRCAQGHWRRTDGEKKKVRIASFPSEWVKNNARDCPDYLKDHEYDQEEPIRVAVDGVVVMEPRDDG